MTTTQKWTPSPTARWVEIEGAVVVLDLASGQYVGLTDRAALSWLRLASQPTCSPHPAQNARLSANEPDGDPGLVDLQRCGLVVPVSAVDAAELPVVGHAPGLPLWALRVSLHASAASAVYSTARVIRQGGMRALHWLLEREGRPGPDRRHALSTTVGAFARAEAITPLAFGHDDCLLRSAALSRLLWSQGHEARFVIGVRLHPFAAHAWVEANHRPLLDDPRFVAQFRPLLIAGVHAQ